MKKIGLLKKSVALTLCFIMAAFCVPSSFAAQSDSFGSGIPPYVSQSREKAVWLDACSAGTSSEIDAVKWYCDSNGDYYFFMPGSADLSSAVIYHNFTRLTIDGKSVLSGETLTGLEKNGSVTMNCDGKNYNVKIMQSSGIASMFLTTESGSMDSINADPNHEYSESGQMLVVDSDGAISYEGELSSIKGRGNTTWRNIEKKPYNIKLPSKASLLGMKASKKWCLLANGQDHSMLRNRVVYDMADEVGLDFSPESRFADVYANGEYLGSYQITEKVELGKNNLVSITDLQGNTEDALSAAGYNSDIESYRLKSDGSYYGARSGYDIPVEPEDITGGYLLEYIAVPEESCHFITDSGQSVDLKTAASFKQVNYIADFVQDMEDALYSPSGYNSKGKHYSDYIDVESAALMYLIEELSVNIDAGISSCFFYKDSDLAGDGKLHAAPVWDYDVAFGNLNTYKDGVNMMDTDSIFAAESRQYGNGKYTIIAQFAHQSEIAKAAEELWNERFVPAFAILNGKATGTGRLKSFDEYRALLKDSADMNYIRWERTLIDNLLVPSAGGTHEEQLEYYIDWMSRREAFMNRTFISVDTVRKAALAELDEYKNSFNKDDYSEESWNEFLAAYQMGTEAINAASTGADVQTALSAAKSEMMGALGSFYVYFDNSMTKWDNVFIYWWGTADVVEWPGKPMTDCGNGIWKYRIGADMSDVIFGDGQQTAQTENLIFPGLPEKMFVPDYNNPSFDPGKGDVYGGSWTDYKRLDGRLGDVNLDGEITLADAIMIQKHVVNILTLDGEQRAIADIDKDGEITIADAIRVQKHVVGIALIA